MASMFQLVIRSGPSAGKVYALDKPEFYIGRDNTNEMVISDPEVSRRHTRLFLQGMNYVIEDLGSTNGTAINGQRLVGPYVLRSGEVITLGEHISLVFEAIPLSDPDATIASPAVQPPAVPVQPVIVQHYAPQPQAQPQPPAYPPRQAYTPPPPPPPAYQPTPVPPMGYEEEPPAERRRLPTWAIIAILVILFLVCVCGAILWVIDSQNLWCDLFPFLFPACQ